MAGRERRLAWQTAVIGSPCLLAISLLLIILLPLDAASAETSAGASNMPAYISIVGISKNVIVRHPAKQEAVFPGDYQSYFILIQIAFSTEACLSRPYCGYSGKWVGNAFGEFGIFCLIQTRKETSSIDNDAIMWLSSWSDSIVLEPVAKHGVIWSCVRADHRIACEPKAINNRAHIGAELPVSSIAGNINRVSSRDHYKGSEESIRDGRNSCPPSPFQAFPIMLAALSLGSLVAAFKGVYRDSDFLIFGGTAVAIISGSALMVWVLSHLPLAILFLPSPPSCHMMLSDFSGLFPRA